jgi:hypothetical protein
MKSGDKNLGFEETYKDQVFSTPEFPKGFIPFAVDDAGDYFLYCTQPEGFGEIMFNRSDYMGDSKRLMLFLCDNLESFVGSLSDPD